MDPTRIAHIDTNPAASRVFADVAAARLAAPIAAGSGALLAVVGLVTGHYSLFGIGALAVAIGVMVRIQRARGRPLPGSLLFLVATAFGLLAPVADTGLGLSIAPVLVVLAVLAIFSTGRRAAIGIGLWCAVLSGWSIHWVYPGLTWTDWLVAGLVLGGTALSGYFVLLWVDDSRLQEEQSFWLLFEASPVAIWELDYTDLIRHFDALRAKGVDDIEAHLADLEALETAADTVYMRRVNSAAMRLGNAVAGRTMRDFVVRGTPNQRRLAVDLLAAAWDGTLSFGLDVKRTLEEDGRRLDAVVHWSVPVVNGRPDYAQVILTASDITPVREAEEKLAVAMASNEMLASHEQAIALCSRALLLGGDDQGLDLALDTLRISTGAGSAVLLRRQADRDSGLSVVAASGPGDPDDAPWEPASEELEILASGRVLDEVVRTPGGPSARLAVPIFSGSNWLGAFWLESRERDRWPAEAVKLLTVAAPMFGAHWEREDSRTRLEELVESKDRFIATVSHELRTPLAAVVGFAEVLKDAGEELNPSELTEMLDAIATQSQDMAYMVEDLLVAARADIGTVVIRPQEVFLRAQVEVTLAGLDTGRLETVDVRGGPGRAWADPGRTRQIVRNLLTNAVRYGGSKVVVECDTVDDVSVMTVTDDGKGLPETEWERIFQPYQRAHEPGTQTASIGLGLTVSRQLARLMGGDLTYHSIPSESVFELRLPAAPPSVQPN